LLCARLFPERQIVLRTGMRRRCFTVSTRLQAGVTLVAVGTALWQGIVTSEWLDSAHVIAYKNHEIIDLRVDRAVAIDSKKSTESRFRGLAARISTEIEDIQRNLALLARHDSMTSKPVAAYTAGTGEPATEPTATPLGKTLEERLARLEESLRTLKSGHSALLATSAETASAQLDRLESALAKVGINTGTLVADAGEHAPDLIAQPAACDEGVGCGGPFVPVKSTDTAGETPPEALHATMQRWDNLVDAMSQLPLGMPVEDMHLSSGFGRRRDPFNGTMAVHAGIDYAGMAYSPVLATGGGVVSYSNRKGRYGNMVEIDHGHGFFTRYGHLAQISVQVGQRVERGTEIGLVGSTGRSTGPHLHYELRVGNEARDPLKYIGVGKNVFERNSPDSQG
jgi:murein DD-endopeptidase MepM/ murein hydrolase activator NlpD